VITIQEIGKFYFVNLVCWDRGSLMSKEIDGNIKRYARRCSCETSSQRGSVMRLEVESDSDRR